MTDDFVPEFAEFARGMEAGGWEFWQVISAYGIWAEEEGVAVMEPEEILRAMDQLGFPRYHLGFVVRRSAKRPPATVDRPESVLATLSTVDVQVAPATTTQEV